jgi:CRP-like cAMP-binding protein
MPTVDRSLVAELPLFAGLAPAALDDILREAHSLHHAKHSVVFTEGDEAKTFSCSCTAMCGRARPRRTASRWSSAMFRPGEVFGVAMAIGLPRYPATATAVDDSVVLVWPAAVWPRLVAKYPALATNALQTVGSRLQDTHIRVVEMSTEQVERRVAHALLRLAQQAGRAVEAGVQIDFPISRQDIAEMTGTTLHTVSRILSAWEEQGLVEGGRQRIVICDTQKLLTLAET